MKRPNTNVVGNTKAANCVVAPAVVTLECCKPLENKLNENHYTVECVKKKKHKRKHCMPSDSDDRKCSADQHSSSVVMKPDVKLKTVAKRGKTAKKCLKFGCSNSTSNSTSLSRASSSVHEALSVDSTVPSKRRKRKRPNAEVDSTVKLKKRQTVDSKSGEVSAVANESSVGPNKCNFSIVKLRSALQQHGRLPDAVSKQDRLSDKESFKHRTFQMDKDTVSASTQHDKIDTNVSESGSNLLASEMVSVGSSSGLLKERMMNRLASARFRFINEQMYRSTGNEAAEMFARDKDAFTVYHAGFQSQVSKWPTNPVDKVIDYVNSR